MVLSSFNLSAMSAWNYGRRLPPEWISALGQKLGLFIWDREVDQLLDLITQPLCIHQPLPESFFGWCEPSRLIHTHVVLTLWQ